MASDTRPERYKEIAPKGQRKRAVWSWVRPKAPMIGLSPLLGCRRGEEFGDLEAKPISLQT